MSKDIQEEGAVFGVIANHHIACYAALHKISPMFYSQVYQYRVLQFYYDTIRQIDTAVSLITQIEHKVNFELLTSSVIVTRHKLLDWNIITTRMYELRTARDELAWRVYGIMDLWVWQLDKMKYRSVMDPTSIRRMSSKLRGMTKKIGNVHILIPQQGTTSMFVKCDNALLPALASEQRAIAVITLFYIEPYIDEVIRHQTVADIVKTMLYELYSSERMCGEHVSGFEHFEAIDNVLHPVIKS